MKELLDKKLSFNNMSTKLALLVLLNFLYLFMCDVSISKLNKDVLKDFENYKFAKIFNETHFSCDDGQKIFDLNKFNDDFCDCKDGSDENSKYRAKILNYFDIFNHQFKYFRNKCLHKWNIQMPE